ncbi:Inorganic triphosphatase [Pandoraea captiosa]|uniref:Inorganic triphosphatase n=1 Tax=Pandoraea captiosa TaxID=2508302 RepID=A0A5E5AMI0_9BURK|nr:CYTH domain-containing protein [Pandoraea captiosa]VVE73300.1 Inorganic triphosphatase [Pandoraea captiosa]
MAIERELKLALPGDLPTARADALISHLDRLPGADARGQRHLVNRYFDTPDLALARAKAALRLRFVARDGHPEQWLQTLKSVGEARDGLHVRHEWELAVPDEALDLAALIAACDMPTTAALLRNEGENVVAQFETNFVRRLWRYVAGDGTTVEIAFDRGEVAVEAEGVRHTEPLVEVELELLDAPDDDRQGQGERILQALAQDLLAVLPELHADNVSKAQRGYRLRQQVLG